MTLRFWISYFDILSPFQPSWFFREVKDDGVTADEPEFLSGAVGQLDEGNGNSVISHYGEIERKCKLLNGLLLAAESETLKEQHKI